MQLRYLGGPGPSITYDGSPLAVGQVVTDEWLANDPRFIAVAGVREPHVKGGLCDQHPRQPLVTAPEPMAVAPAPVAPRRGRPPKTLPVTAAVPATPAVPPEPAIDNG